MAKPLLMETQDCFPGPECLNLPRLVKDTTKPQVREGLEFRAQPEGKEVISATGDPLIALRSSGPSNDYINKHGPPVCDGVEIRSQAGTDSEQVRTNYFRPVEF